MMEPGPGELDPVVVANARYGNKQAFAQIVEHYQRPVYNLAYRMLGSAGEAEDAAQETFLRVYRQLKTYRPGSRFAPWIFSIAAHYCIDRLRRKKPSWLSLEDETVENTVPTSEAGPEERAIAEEQKSEVQRLLGRIQPAYRLVLSLKYWNDLSVEEIAHITGDSTGAVKVKLFRARQAVAREMKREGQTRQAGNASTRLGRALNASNPS